MTGRTRRGRWSGGALLAAVLVGGCATETDGPGGPPPEWTAGATLLEIGETEGDPRYLFDGVAALALLGDGGVVVADGGSGTLRVYAPDGTHRASMGGLGQGPGELDWVNYLDIRPPDTIVVYDGAVYRLTRFLLDGTLVGDRTFRPDRSAPELYLGTYPDGDAAIASLVPSPRGGTEVLPDRMALARYGADGLPVGDLAVVDGIRRTGGIGAVPFTPQLHAFLVRDSIFHTDGRRPVLEVLDERGAPARTVSFEIAPPDAARAWSVLRTELEAREQLSWLDGLTPQAEAEPPPAIAEVLLDEDGRFWLKHYDPRTDPVFVREGLAAGGRWTIVRADGSVVAHAGLPDRFAPLAARGTRVAGVLRDDLGVERVVVLELEEAQGG